MKILFWYKLSTILLFFSLIVFGVFLFWIGYPYQPVKFNVVPFPIETKIVKNGEMLIYDVNYCKYNDLIPTSTKSFVDDIIYSLPETVALAKQKGCAKIRVSIQIPISLPPGSYSLHITYRYKVNPIRTVDVPAQTDNFQVIK